MEIVSYVSSIALVGFVLSKLYEIFQTWSYSTVVVQLMNMAIVLKNIFVPMLLNFTKEIVVLLKDALHLVLHILAQTILMVQNLANIVMFLGKSLYVLLYTFNGVFHFIESFQNWLYTLPVRNITWYSTILVLTCILFAYYKLRSWAKYFGQIKHE